MILPAFQLVVRPILPPYGSACQAYKDPYSAVRIACLRVGGRTEAVYTRNHSLQAQDVAVHPTRNHPAPQIASWAQQLLRTGAGDLLLRKTADPTVVQALQRWFFPLSRLWAAANEASGDLGRFRHLRGRDGIRDGAIAAQLVSGVLRGHDAARRRMIEARRNWETGAFGESNVEPADFGRLEARRRRSATLHLATRTLFYPLMFPTRPVSAFWEIPAPLEVDALWGEVLDNPQVFFAQARAAEDVAESPAVARGPTREFWIRFPTPAPRLAARPESRFCYARVNEPSDGRPVPTLIAGSGLCLETDLIWPATFEASGFILGDFRIVDIVSPYHGLRAFNDRYGGEPFLATAPLGTIDLVLGQTLETAALVGWARQRFGGKVAVGGMSMTSLVAQQVASRCDAWHEPLRPDAVLLMAHSGDLADVILRSALVQSIGLDKALQRAGWTEEKLRRWSALLDPTPQPAMSPQQIVSTLGTSDRVLPYGGGAALVQRWQLPPQNVFHFPIGHLLLPLGLMRDDQPLRRLHAILTDGA